MPLPNNTDICRDVLGAKAPGTPFLFFKYFG